MTNQATNEVELENAGKVVPEKLYNALQRLKENDDFKLVILDGFLREKAIGVTHALSEPSNKPYRSNMFEELAGISVLKYHLDMIDYLGAPSTTDDEDEE